MAAGMDDYITKPVQRTKLHEMIAKWTGLDELGSPLSHTLQHIATHCNTLQHIAVHCNTLQHTATHCDILQHTK